MCEGKYAHTFTSSGHWSRRDRRSQPGQCAPKRPEGPGPYPAPCIPRPVHVQWVCRWTNAMAGAQAGFCMQSIRGSPPPAQVHGGTGARKDLYVYPGDCGDNAPHHMTLPCQGTCTHRVAVLIWASSGNEVDGARALQPHRPSSAICLAG